MLKTSIIGLLSRFARDRRGVSAIEFAFIAPVMIGLYLGCSEISDGVAADRKVSLIAGALSNLSAQSTTISTTQMTNILDASSAIISPYSASLLKMTVSCIKIDGAFDRHDAHECALRFVDDADFVSVSGLTFHGRKAIEDHYVSSFSSTLKDAHRTDTVKSIRFLSPDIASVDVDWEMTGARTADGSERPPRKGLLEPVLVKQNGQWSIAVFHETEFNVSSGR